MDAQSELEDSIQRIVAWMKLSRDEDGNLPTGPFVDEEVCFRGIFPNGIYRAKLVWTRIES
jgi:hypothetical protein